MNFSVLRECSAPETVRRPSLILIWGPSGSGKTRLLSALADLLRVRMGGAILYCSAHELVENLVENIRRGTCKDFRDSLMAYRALLVDNIWTLACRPHAAREIFSCLRMCLCQGCRVFIASDLAPVSHLDMVRRNWRHHQRKPHLSGLQTPFPRRVAVKR